MEEVKYFIKDCFSAISAEDLHSIMDLLTKLGVESFDDLQHVEPEKDLTSVLKVIQARKLKFKIETAFNKQDTSIVQPQLVEVIQPSASFNDGEVIEMSKLVIKQNSDTNSLLENIPFDKLPKALLSKLEKGEVPSPSERREAVRVIIAGVMEFLPTPRKVNLEAVAMEVVRRFPNSFKDTIGADSIGLGHSSLLCQLITRAENCRRSTGVLKRKISSEYARLAPKRLAESYGCVNHQPDNFPDGESETTQAEKKAFLKNEHLKIERDEAKIFKFMKDTFASQRMLINGKAPMKLVKTEWSFLAERKFLMQHTDQLLGFSLREKFDESIQHKLGELVRYGKTKGLDFNPPHLHLLEILCGLFSEEIELLIKIYEEDKSLMDISNEVPVTPFIACIGDPYELENVCTVFVEKEPLEANIPLDDALLMWFSAFYVLNLIYPKECCATLEFIQRALFGINPETKGSKMEKRFGKKVAMHPKVLKMINSIKNFSSKWNI